MLVYEEGEKALPPKHLEYRQKFLGNLAKSQLEFEEVRNYFTITKAVFTLALDYGQIIIELNMKWVHIN